MLLLTPQRPLRSYTKSFKSSKAQKLANKSYTKLIFVCVSQCSQGTCHASAKSRLARSSHRRSIAPPSSQTSMKWNRPSMYGMSRLHPLAIASDATLAWCIANSMRPLLRRRLAALVSLKRELPWQVVSQLTHQSLLFQQHLCCRS